MNRWLVGVLVLSIVGNAILGAMIYRAARSKVEMLTYYGLSFVYPRGWQILDKILDTLDGNDTYINVSYAQLWWPMGINRDVIMSDRVIKNEDESLEKKLQKLKTDSNNYPQGSRLVKVTKMVSPHGIEIWKTEGEVVEDRSPVTEYYFEYNKMYPAGNGSPGRRERHVVVIMPGQEIGQSDTKSSKLIMDQLVKTLRYVGR